MANYEFIVASNEFKTKNNEEVANVFLDLGFEETYVTGNDNVFVGSYGEGSIGWDDCKVIKKKDTGKVVLAYDTDFDLSELLVDRNMTGDDLENTEEIDLVKYMQSMLLDNEYFAIKEIGNEKLRYVGGHACLITKTEETWFNLDQCIDNELKQQGYEV